jgi:hypothetical protein
MQLKKPLAITFFSASAIILSFALLRSPAQAAGGAHCHCKAIVYIGNNGGNSIANPLIDLGDVESYNTQLGHNSDCEAKCSAAAAQNPNFNDKTWLCQHVGCGPGQHRVSAYAAVGTLHYNIAQSIYFTCTGGVTTCTCPAGWYSNTTNQLAGVTGDGKCKKPVCTGISVPPPANGTQVGSWGFTWGDSLIAYGSTENGGAAVCTTTPCVGH